MIWRNPIVFDKKIHSNAPQLLSRAAACVASLKLIMAGILLLQLIPKAKFYAFVQIGRGTDMGVIFRNCQGEIMAAATSFDPSCF